MLNKDKYNRKAETTNLKINKGCKGGQLIAKLGFANTFHDWYEASSMAAGEGHRSDKTKIEIIW